MGRRRNGPLLSTRDDDDDDDDDEVRSLQAPNIQCESKNPPLRFSDIFPRRLGIFNHFYKPIVHSFLH